MLVAERSILKRKKKERQGLSSWNENLIASSYTIRTEILATNISDSGVFKCACEGWKNHSLVAILYLLLIKGFHMSTCSCWIIFFNDLISDSVNLKCQSSVSFASAHTPLITRVTLLPFKWTGNAQPVNIQTTYIRSNLAPLQLAQWKMAFQERGPKTPNLTGGIADFNWSKHFQTNM